MEVDSPPAASAHADAALPAGEQRLLASFIDLTDGSPGSENEAQAPSDLSAAVSGMAHMSVQPHVPGAPLSERSPPEASGTAGWWPPTAAQMEEAGQS